MKKIFPPRGMTSKILGNKRKNTNLGNDKIIIYGWQTKATAHV